MIHNALRRFSGTALLLLALVSSASARESFSSIRQSVHNSWRTEEGLPQNSVQAILQTRDGFLWMGTQEGLVRFDAANFKVFSKGDTEAIRSNDIRTLFEDREGTLWIGTFGGGLVKYRDGNFQAYTTAEGLSDNSVSAILQDKDGNLWIGTRNGLDELLGGHLVHRSETAGLAQAAVNVLAEDHDGSLWVGTNNGLYQLPPRASGPATLQQSFSGLKIKTLQTDNSGNLWIGTERHGLYRLSSGRVIHYGPQQGLPNVPILSVFQESGGLWVGTYAGGLCHLATGESEKFECSTSNDGLSDNTVLSILRDREGSLWVGTLTGGLNQFRQGSFTIFDSSDLAKSSARSIYQGRDGSIWVGSDSGLRRYKDGHVTPYTANDGHANESAWSVIEGRDGSIWVGTSHGGLHQFTKHGVKIYTMSDGLADDRVYSVFEDHTGALWIGTEKGVSRLLHGRFTTFTTRDGLSSNFVWTIFEDHAHTLWFGTYGGLNLFQNGKFIGPQDDSRLAIHDVDYFFEDRDHVLWMGTAGEGLKRLKDNKITSYTPKEGLFDDTIWAILDDDRGHFWMSSNRGIFKVNKSELDAFADGKISRINSRSYGIADGASPECNGGSQSPAWKTTDGRLLFACVRGVVAIDPSNFPHNDLPPPVVIEQASLQGKLLKDNAEIPAGRGKLEFHFAALTYLAPARTIFKYKLEPYDKEWTFTSRGEAVYTNVPPGHYRFRVGASNNDGVWNSAGASFGFYFQPHFYQTIWFYSCCGVIVVLLGLGLWLLRARQIRRREEQLVEQVDERTRELQQQISIRREVERDLARTAAIVESSSDAIWSTDLHGTVITWNSGAERLFGYRADEMIGCPVYSIVPRERHDEMLEYFEKLRQGECINSIETVRQSKNGHLVDLSLSLSPIFKEGFVIGISVIARDITERKRAHEVLQQAKEEAEAATRAKSEFLANMSHEIRTPLNGVLGMLELAKNTGLDADQKDLLAMAQSSANTLLVVINDILDFSKIEVGKLELDCVEFNLAETVSEVVQALALRAHEKDLELLDYVSPDIPRWVRGDPSRLRQVLINLLGNAIKFTEQGEVMLHVHGERLNGDDVELKFSVTDTGVGIPVEKQPLVFEPFSQADASITRKYGGTGLGLAICSRIVALMGGRIWLESEVGQGSTFYFTAIFALASEAVNTNGKPHEAVSNGYAPSRPIRKLRVLVAEDNLVNQKLVVRFLESAGHAWVVADTGKEALQKLQGEAFDVILMDVQMPEMDGLAATVAIRAQEQITKAHVPIIAMTAHAMKGDRERCLEAGMDEYLAKPITLHDLLAAIYRVTQTSVFQTS